MAFQGETLLTIGDVFEPLEIIIDKTSAINFKYMAFWALAVCPVEIPLRTLCSAVMFSELQNYICIPCCQTMSIDTGDSIRTFIS